VVPKVISAAGGGHTLIEGSGSPAVEVAASPPAVRLWPVAWHSSCIRLQILVPSARRVRLDVGGRLNDGGQVDAEQLRAPLQRCRDRPAQVRVVPDPTGAGYRNVFETGSGMFHHARMGASAGRCMVSIRT
jgi:hypothetical protein